jgi:hypothetical protein
MLGVSEKEEVSLVVMGVLLKRVSGTKRAMPTKTNADRAVDTQKMLAQPWSCPR